MQIIIPIPTKKIDKYLELRKEKFGYPFRFQGVDYSYKQISHKPSIGHTGCTTITIK